MSLKLKFTRFIKSSELCAFKQKKVVIAKDMVQKGEFWQRFSFANNQTFAMSASDKRYAAVRLMNVTHNGYRCTECSM